MTTKRLIKAIEGQGYAITGFVKNGRSYIYYNNQNVLEFRETQDGQVTGGVYIRSKNQHDDIQSDYFAGTFYHSINRAVDAFNYQLK